MPDYPYRRIVRLLREDPRYTLEAYQFVKESLAYAQDVLGLGAVEPKHETEKDENEVTARGKERHLTGQQLCEASRRYALEQYGLLAKVVLKSWGIRTTADLGEIVYNLIRIDLMKKSETDRREDFHDVFDFETALDERFQFTAPDTTNT
jgi:uncharacterized repeat protein (TIGR04138 family)